MEDMFLLARADAGQRRIVANRFLFRRDRDRCAYERTAARRCATGEDRSATSWQICHMTVMRNWRVSCVESARQRRQARSNRAGVGRIAMRGAALRLTVSDDGAGVASTTASGSSKGREARSDSHRDGGAGLGLSIARWVAEGARRDIDLTDAIAGRTTFEARLPYAHLVS
jgi:hypothetical protein